MPALSSPARHHNSPTAAKQVRRVQLAARGMLAAIQVYTCSHARLHEARQPLKPPAPSNTQITIKHNQPLTARARLTLQHALVEQDSSRRFRLLTPPNTMTTATRDSKRPMHAALVHAAHRAGRPTFFRQQQPGHGTSVPAAMTHAGCSQSTAGLPKHTTNRAARRKKTQLMYR